MHGVPELIDHMDSLHPPGETVTRAVFMDEMKERPLCSSQFALTSIRC